MSTKIELIKIRDRLKNVVKYQNNNPLFYINYDKYPEQTEAIERAVNRAIYKIGPKFIVILGGNQSGKSEAGAIVVSRVFNKLNNARILGATIETKLSINVQQRKYSEWLHKNDIQYGEYNPIRGWKQNVIIGKNGQKIVLKTYAQGWEAFQGDEYDLIHLDEEPDWGIFQECIMRTVKRNGCILLTFTSLQGFTNVVNFVYESKNPEVWSTLLDLYFNPYIPKENKDIILATIDPDEIESRIHGRPHLKTGLIYKNFGDIHRIERFDYKKLIWESPDRYVLHEGIDPHEKTPHHWLRFLYDTKEDILFVVEELKAPIESQIIKNFCLLIHEARGYQYNSPKHKSIPEICQIDTSSMKPTVIATAEDEEQNSAMTIRKEFFNNDIETVLVQKDNAIGIQAVKERLVHTKEKSPKFFVFRDLVGVNWEFKRYSWDSYSSEKVAEKKEAINKPKKKDDHYMDIIKYECIMLKTYTKLENDFKIENEYYDSLYRIGV